MLKPARLDSELVLMSAGSVIAIEDSGAGVCSARIAGYTTIGLAGGNIKESGTMPMCSRYCNNLAEILDYIEEEA